MASGEFTLHTGSTFRIQNTDLAYRSSKNTLYYVSSDLFESYELFLKLNELVGLSGLIGLEPGAGFGEVSAIMALFCSSVLMVEINPELFAWAQKLLALLPVEISNKITGINGNVKTLAAGLGIIRRSPVCFYDYVWLDFGPAFNFAPGSIIISAHKSYSSLQLHNYPLEQVYHSPHSTIAWKKLT